MMHYINKNEDVLVSMEQPDPSVWCEIPIGIMNNNSSITIINANSVYAYCMARNLAYETKSEGITLHEKINNALSQLCFNVPTKEAYLNQYSIHTQLNKAEYKWYDYLMLSTLYGGNNRHFVLIKPFIVPATYIKEITNKYDSKIVNKFIKQLIIEGSITINNS